MNDKKISQLTPLENPTGNEEFPVAIDGKNYKVKVKDVKPDMSDYVTSKQAAQKYYPKVDGENLEHLVETLNEGIGALDNDVYKVLFIVVSEALCQLRAEISSLREAISNLGNANAVSYDCDMGYLVCGQKTFDVVDGAPTEIPRSVGLFRFDKTTKTLYVSDELTNSTKDWKMIS